MEIIIIGLVALTGFGTFAMLIDYNMQIGENRK